MTTLIVITVFREIINAVNIFLSMRVHSIAPSARAARHNINAVVLSSL